MCNWEQVCVQVGTNICATGNRCVQLGVCVQLRTSVCASEIRVCEHVWGGWDMSMRGMERVRAEVLRFTFRQAEEWEKQLTTLIIEASAKILSAPISTERHFFIA